MKKINDFDRVLEVKKPINKGPFLEVVQDLIGAFKRTALVGAELQGDDLRLYAMHRPQVGAVVLSFTFKHDEVVIKGTGTLASSKTPLEFRFALLAWAKSDPVFELLEGLREASKLPVSAYVDCHEGHRVMARVPSEDQKKLDEAPLDECVSVQITLLSDSQKMGRPVRIHSAGITATVIDSKILDSEVKSFELVVRKEKDEE